MQTFWIVIVMRIKQNAFRKISSKAKTNAFDKKKNVLSNFQAYIPFEIICLFNKNRNYVFLYN